MKKTIKVALIGVGGMAALHAKAIEHVDGIEFVSCASRSLEKATAFAKIHGISNPRLVDDVLAAPNADAIWVVAPADVMDEVAIEFSNLDLPLFLEKPVGFNVAETERVARAVKAPNMVGLNRRFYSIFDDARKLIDQAGGIRGIEMQLTEFPSSLVGRYSQKALDGWHYGNSVHMIDLFRFFGGEVSKIQSMNDIIDTQDRTYLSLLKFKNGCNGIYNAQWYAASGWRLTLYANDLSIQFQPVEQATVYNRVGRSQLSPAPSDINYKPGLVEQAKAFANLVDAGTIDERAINLVEYVKTQKLVEALSR